VPPLPSRQHSGTPLLRRVRRPLAVSCGSCGFSNDPGIKFCGGCGAPLGAAPSTATAKFASPDAYTPKHLAEKVLTSKASLEGERKQVMGDGIMALFGAPLAHEDHGVRACYAALRMQEAIRRYTEDVRRAPGVEVQIRVGINSGEVVVRSVGSDLRMDYTAVGGTTHLAARMEQLATPGTIRLTAATLALAEGYVAVKPLGPVPVKGLGDPGRGLRGDGGRAGPDPPAGVRPARADAVRRPRRRAGAAPSRSAARGRRSRSGGGHRRRGTLHRDRLGEQIERLAHHALRGELQERAVDYLRQAGLKAFARSALQDARVWLEQALGALEALPERRSALEQAFEIRLELRSVLNQLGEGRQVLERLREAEALAERLNDDRRQGRVCAFAMEQRP